MKRILPRITLALVALAAMGGATGCYSTPEGGETIVVRNGGPLDDKQIRQVVPNGSGNTWTGWLSESRPYPASDQQRIYKMESSGDEKAKGADSRAALVPTRNGVRAEITGTFYFTTAFDGSAKGEKLLREFDTKFGNREFDGAKPWQDGGWGRFLNAVVQPVIDSNLRNVVAQFQCAELVSSCALVQNDGNVSASKVTDKNNAENVQRIQDRVQEGLVNELRNKLGNDYFSNIKFNLQSVELPGVQAAIDEAQSAFAEVTKAQAKVEQAKADRRANEEKEKGYNVCASCARQDEYKALPQGLQALGGSFVVAPK